jgi:hypothetical protein
MRRKAVGLWNKWKEDVPVKEEIPVTTTTAETTIITEPPALIDNTGCGSRDRVSTSLESRIQRMNESNDAETVTTPPPPSRIWNRDGINGSANKTTAAPPAGACRYRESNSWGLNLLFQALLWIMLHPTQENPVLQDFHLQIHHHHLLMLYFPFWHCN